MNDKEIYITIKESIFLKMLQTLETGAGMVVPFNRDNSIMALSAIKLMQDSLNSVIETLNAILEGTYED